MEHAAHYGIVSIFTNQLAYEVAKKSLKSRDILTQCTLPHWKMQSTLRKR
jgi:hypothetical protein